MAAANHGRFFLHRVVGGLLAGLMIAVGLAAGIAVEWQARHLTLPQSEVRELRFWIAGTLAAAVPTAMLVAWVLARLVSRPLRELAADARAIREFRFDGPARRSWLREIDALGLAQHEMRGTIRQFLDISARLAGDQTFSGLLHSVVRETLAATRLRAAVIYLRQPDGSLAPAAWRDVGNRDGLPAPHALPAELDLDHPLLEPVRHKCRGSTVLSPAVPPAGLEWLTAWFPGRGVNLLTVPLLNRPGDIVGVLCLASPGEDGAFPSELEAFVGALSGVIAVAIDQQHLMDERARLFDAFVRVVAHAIDARSPHTGAHCQRVPLLAEMLADAAEASGRLHLSEDDRATLRLAAWLHDCGKIALPDFVSEKPTKLAAFHDRLHEVRMRFEVLKRDAEIAYWRDRYSGGDDAALRSRLEREWQALDDDFAFVAGCNLGTEALPDGAARRLARIGERVWQRTLDDRLGLARDETERKVRVPPRPLPAPEHVLADRLEHLVDWLPGEPLSLAVAGTWLRPPRHKLNLGERYNLGVARGTLTAEERYLVDAHASRTLAMLRELPWPRRLRGVPDIAGAHHEHPDGSGHPRGLRGEEIDPMARILAIADVFEALSARDRPYKTARSAAEALSIMADMARANHLDRELFALLLTSGAWRRYGERFLAADQLDAVDAPALLRTAGVP
ncbi:MAG: HD domain-containing phosphohydrolase [Sulfurisoma sp.]|nr:HD domain-containing phosphohydrolase [Sulfurisoma sp.]